MCRPCSLHERKEEYDMSLEGTLEGKRPLGRPRRRWEDNIMFLR
jgi:hypothetical protein